MILIVENEPLIAMDMEQAFQDNGETILRVTTHKAALQAWKKHASEITAIILNHNLGDGPTGMDFHDHVRQKEREADKKIEEGEGVFIALVTGYNPSDVLKGHGKLIGTPFAFIPKPFLQSQLRETVAQRPLWRGMPVARPNRAI